MRRALLLLLLYSSSTSLFAQRVNSLGVTIDANAGLEKDPSLQFGLQPSASDNTGFYSLNPSVAWTSQGARSLMNLGYTYGWTRQETTPPHDTDSHSASLSYSSTLSPRWTFSASNFFSSTSDARTFLALRGVQQAPDESGFLLFFYPVATQVVSRDNTTSVGFTNQLSQRSSISFGGSFYLRRYSDQGISGLSNQQGGGANFSYSRRLSERTSWSVGYNGSYYDFEGFSDAFSNAVNVGLSRVLAKDMTMNWSIGVSHLKNVDSSGSGVAASYEGSAGITKTIKGNNFNLSVSQDNGRPSGAGSVSRNRRASLGFGRDLGKVVNVFADASLFDSKGVLDNTVNVKGGSATANVGFAITRQLSLHVGGIYQRYNSADPFGFSQKRLFASIRYSHPTLWHSR